VGERAGGEARDGASEPPDVRYGDVARIAEAVREAVGARAVTISRVVDDEWLEVVALAGELPGEDLATRRWRRADLARVLDTAEQLGRLHVTTNRAVSYVEVPAGGEGVPGESAVLLAPLHTAEGNLVGVLATDGLVDIDALPDGACDLVELYAEQARLTLDLVRAHATLAEHLRLSDASQAVLHEAVVQPDVPAMLESVAGTVARMMRARGVWACAEIATGVHAEAASYPAEVAQWLGVDICALVEPIVGVCWRDDSTASDEDAPLLGRLAALAGRERALLSAIGSGTEVRGALLVLRSHGDPPWADHERDALRALGRRLGSVVQQLVSHQRDRHLVDELRELDEYRRDLVASITHDLKTPLTAITLNTELLASDRRLAQAGSHPVAAIRRSAERLSGLVDDLLALARAEEGGTRHVVVADLVVLVHDACRHAEVEAQQRGVRFVLDLPDELPEAVDADAVARIYANVVSNAVKFSLPEGEVRVAVRRVGDAVEFVCADDGIGISPEDQATVFDMSGRSHDPASRSLTGSGIGLAISHRIVSRLGGSIDVESTQGVGSTFTVRIPAAPASS
jgi:signal transduction histidine kinase